MLSGGHTAERGRFRRDLVGAKLKTGRENGAKFGATAPNFGATSPNTVHGIPEGGAATYSGAFTKKRQWVLQNR